MPQMNTVLLPTVEASTEKQMVQSNKLDSNSSENKDFSLALAEASSLKHSSNADNKAETGRDKFDKVSSESIEDTAEDSGDVSNVLAQINLAVQFAEDEPIAADGVQLPLVNTELDEQELGSEHEDLEQTLLQNHISDGTGAVDVALSEPIDGKSSPDSLVDEDSSVQLNGALIEQLTPIQLDNLVEQTGLDKEQLIELPPQMLQVLITEVNKFALQGVDQQALPARIKSLIEQANKLVAELDVKTDIKTDVKAKDAEQPSVNVAFNSSVTDKPVPKGDVTTEPTTMAGQSGQRKSILGEIKSDSAGKPAIASEQNIQVSQEVQAGRGGNSVDLNNAKLSVVMAADSDGVDTAVSQINEAKPTNQGMTGTTLIRSETPVQYQVSIKPNGEPAQHIQEMIQKFSPVMQQQLLTMVKQGVQHAEIRLDPPELGHMMVRIQVQGDQTQVQFQVAQHQTKDLVEQAIPRLRELLAEQGMQLTDSNVSQGGSGHKQNESDGNHDHGQHLGSDMDEISAEESLLASNSITSYRSGIDYYA